MRRWRCRDRGRPLYAVSVGRTKFVASVFRCCSRMADYEARTLLPRATEEWRSTSNHTILTRCSALHAYARFLPFIFLPLAPMVAVHYHLSTHVCRSADLHNRILEQTKFFKFFPILTQLVLFSEVVAPLVTSNMSDVDHFMPGRNRPKYEWKVDAKETYD